MKHHLTALPTPLIEGIENTLHELKMSLIVDEMPDHELTSDEIMTGIMQQTTADGLLVNYHHAIPQQLIEIVVRHNIPAAWINVKRERDCAYPDDYQGSLLAVDKYLEMGLRDIVYVDYSHVQVRTAHFSASDRYHGYLEAMSRKGLVPRAFFNREPHVKPLYRHELAAEHLFSGNKPPEAIICYSPATACPILLAATAAGISIPESTRILSFHDEILVYHGLPLDTALIPLADLGKHVVELLLKRINTGQSLDPVSVSYKEPRLAQR
jgi:LacI family transcriptional regulator